MTPLELMLDGAMVAAELLALLFFSPATGQEPASLERPVRLHRLSTSVDVRLLGSLADLRVAQAVRNESSTTADLAPQLPAVDEHIDGPRVVQGTHAAQFLPGGACADIGGHARLSEDERIADAPRLAPGAVIEAIAAQPLIDNGRSYLVVLPVQAEADEIRAMLVDEEEGPFLLLVPHRAARRATLVLRPVAGDPETLHLGAIDARHAVVVPLPDCTYVDALAEGAVELELIDGLATWWTTLIPDRVEVRPAVHARTAE